MEWAGRAGLSLSVLPIEICYKVNPNCDDE